MDGIVGNRPFGAGCAPTFLQRVGMGLEPGYSFIEKFGENTVIDTASAPEDVWDGGLYALAGLYTFSTTADIDTLSSTSAADTMDVTIIGQLIDNTEITQTVTLAGLAKVTLPIPLFRIYRMFNAGTTDIVGNVTCYPDTGLTAGVPTDKTQIRAMITDGNNQTQMCIYTVPKGKVGYFLKGYVATTATGNKDAVFTWRLRTLGSVFRVQSKIAVIGAGSSTWQYEYPVPVGPIPAGSDIIIRVESVGANATGVAGGFSMLLKDTDAGVLSTTYECPGNKWTKVADSVNAGVIQTMLAGKYVAMFLPAGTAAPADTDETNTVHFDGESLPISVSVNSDVYVKCRADAGRVRVDL